MNPQTERRTVDGPVGVIEVAVDRPPAGPSRGVAVLCHPHPLFAGTLDNKVVQTLARAHVAAGWTTWRFNVRGVGGSAGTWDEGVGERDDAWAVLEAARAAEGAPATAPVAIGGFSFGGYLATRLAARARDAGLAVASTVLVAPSVVKFEALPVGPGALVVHGGDDDVVAMADVLAWAAPQHQPVVVIPGVGHFFHGQLPLLKQVVLRHLHTLA